MAKPKQDKPKAYAIQYCDRGKWLDYSYRVGKKAAEKEAARVGQFLGRVQIQALMVRPPELPVRRKR